MIEEAKHLTECEKAKVCFYENEIAMLNNAVRRTALRRDELRDALNLITQQVECPPKHLTFQNNE